MRRNVRSRFARLALFASLGACAAKAATQRAYIAPSSDTITSDTDVLTGDPPTHVITVYNRSSVPITVWNVALNGCQNIKQTCGPRRTNIRVAAGGSAMAARVEPDNPRASFTYRFHYSWRPDSSTRGAAISALASADPSLSGILRELTPNDFRTLSARIARIRPDPESLFMTPGDRAFFNQIRIHVLDGRDSVLGFTRLVGRSVYPGAGVQFAPPDLILARRPGRASVRFQLAADAQNLLARPVPDTELPIVVAYRFEPNAPVFKGRALDGDSKTPLSCVRVAVEDSAQNVVNNTRADATGAFTLKAPRPGAYRVRVETHGWYPWHSAATPATANEEKNEEHQVRFTEQLLVTRAQMAAGPEYEPAHPAAVRFEPVPARASSRSTPIIHGVTLTGSQTMPILDIRSPLPPQTLWTQFMVDSAGRVDTASIVLPPNTAANVRSTVRYVMPRVRFTPARDSGKPTCELVRLQVNVSPR